MSDRGAWSAPEPLHADHDLSTFGSGEPTLDEWLKNRAWFNEGRGASRTYVLRVDDQVAGYYCLATGSVGSELAPGALRRNMPNPLPVMVLGRLAVDLAWQGHGVGKLLLRDAVLRTIQVSNVVGVKALMVHAVSEQARRFYESQGFIASPTNSRTLFLSLLTVTRGHRKK